MYQFYVKNKTFFLVEVGIAVRNPPCEGLPACFSDTFVFRESLSLTRPCKRSLTGNCSLSFTLCEELELIVLNFLKYFFG